MVQWKRDGTVYPEIRVDFVESPENTLGFADQFPSEVPALGDSGLLHYYGVDIYDGSFFGISSYQLNVNMSPVVVPPVLPPKAQDGHIVKVLRLHLQVKDLLGTYLFGSACLSRIQPV